MKRYPAWQALYRSFYHTDFYRDVASNWKGLGFLYLFLLAGVSSLIAAVAVFFFLAQLCDRHLLPIADQFPTITSKNDNFSMDKPSPYYVKDDVFGTVFTFDTSGNTKTLDHPGILVTDQAVINEQQKVGSTDLQESVVMQASGSNGSFGKAEARNIVLMLRNFGPLVVFGFCLVWFTSSYFCQALFYGTLGLIFNAVLKTQLSYLQLVRLAALAMTPPVLVNWLIAPVYTMNLGIQMGISFVISMGYLFIGIRACKPLLWSTESPFPSASAGSPASQTSASATSYQSEQSMKSGATPEPQPEQPPTAPDSPEQPPVS
jgi:hypothetical protein